VIFASSAFVGLVCVTTRTVRGEPAILLQAQTTARAPKLSDLPRLRKNLRAAVQPLDDKEFSQFVQSVFYESDLSAPEIATVDWMDELRALAEERKLSERTLAYLDLHRAYYVSAVLGDRDGGLQLLESALARYLDRVDYRAELALLAENIAQDEEHWNAAREYLAQAEESLAAVPATSDLMARFHGASADLWIHLGLPEIARSHVEFELEHARAGNDPEAFLGARTDELKLLVLEENYDAVYERYAELPCEPWFDQVSVTEQGDCLLHVAAGLLAAEHDEVEPRGSAAALLDELLKPGRLDAAMRGWALRHRAVCAANEGDWRLVRNLCNALRGEIGAVGLPDDRLPSGRLGAALIGLEARIELAQSSGLPDRERRLRPHLDRVRRAWNEFLSHWSGAPVRGGGLAYLHIAERHQLLQELIDLELGVEGESRGASSALQHVLDAEQQSTFARRMRLSPTVVDEIQRELTDSQSGLLVYLPSRDRSFVFAIDPRGVRLFRLDAEYRVRGPCHRLAGAAQSAVRDGRGIDDSELRTAAVDCARVLLPEELEKHIAAWRELIVVGIDDFGYVPFELLPARDGGTQGTRRAISYSPTVAMALALERKPEPAAGHARLLLAPEVEGLALALDDSQLAELTSSVSRESEILIGRAAAASRLGVATVDSVNLLYVLAHGTHDATRERPGGLLLASSLLSRGTIWAEDIEALCAPALVVLTACEAGRAPMRRGDGGRSDLAAAFLYAGAVTVVLPTCDLEVAATLRAVPLVLRSVSDGVETAEALRSARAELIAKHDSDAALQAHLLHVVGRGRLSLPADEGARGADSHSRAGWMLLSVVGIALAVWVALFSIKQRASRAGAPHGSRP
jgi:hypothetical protein